MAQTSSGGDERTMLDGPNVGLASGNWRPESTTIPPCSDRWTPTPEVPPRRTSPPISRAVTGTPTISAIANP